MSEQPFEPLPGQKCVAARLTCPLCLGLLVEPYFHADCQAAFCASCLDSFKDANSMAKPLCPCCRGEITELYPDRLRRDLLDDVAVKCSLCMDWSGSLLQFRENHHPTCPSSSIQCPMCTLTMNRRSLQTHQEKYCLQRPVQCKFCKHTYPLNEMIEHCEFRCQDSPIACPHSVDFSCDAVITRATVLDHLQSNCCAQNEKSIFSKINLSSQQTRSQIEHCFALTKSKFMWIIPRFGELSPVVPFLESAKFPDDTGSRWMIRIYPSGDGVDASGWVSIGAYKEDDLEAAYSVRVVHPNGGQLDEERDLQPVSGKWRTAGWGWKRFISHAELESRGFIQHPSDSLVLLFCCRTRSLQSTGAHSTHLAQNAPATRYSRDSLSRRSQWSLVSPQPSDDAIPFVSSSRATRLLASP